MKKINLISVRAFIISILVFALGITLNAQNTHVQILTTNMSGGKCIIEITLLGDVSHCSAFYTKIKQESFQARNLERFLEHWFNTGSGYYEKPLTKKQIKKIKQSLLEDFFIPDLENLYF